MLCLTHIFEEEVVDVAGELRYPRVVVIVSALAILMASTLQGSVSGAPNATTVREGNDFATRVLRDPWDMSEFSDISAYLNDDGQFNILQNIQVQNGIFSAQTTNTDSRFYALFPGISGTIQAGKVGARYPISASTFHCLYLAMYIPSSSPVRVFWFADAGQNWGGGAWGETAAISGASPWRLYSLDLATAPRIAGNTSWTGSQGQQWQGLRISPTARSGVTFHIDWVRLTDCSPVNTTISWSGNPTSLWLTSAGSSNSILVKTGLSGTSTVLDTQGLVPGTYQLCLSSSSSSCNSVASPNPSSITVNQAPVATFSRPSFTSGVDYATQAGNAWDFDDGADVSQTYNLSWSLGGGVMNMTTAPGSLPAGADPYIYLNAPQPIASGSQYRYLTFRLNTQWPIQRFGGGTLVRWVWGMSNGCQLVSQDIPYDVGWQTLTIDLSDSYNGSVEQSGGPCGPGPFSWSSSGPITSLRFDPNENVLGANLSQQLDWIRLTQVDKVAHGTPFPVQISLNKSPQGVSTTFYYTTNRQQPTQHVASQYVASPPPPPAGSHRLYLPLTLNSTNVAADGPAFLWNTTSVASGSYYVCVVADDTLNQATYCSDAPVQVN